MTQLTKRQQKIIDFIAAKNQVQNQEIVDFFIADNDPLSRETVARELRELVALRYLIKTGRGRGVAYSLVEVHPLLKPIGFEEYLSKDQDVRAPGVINFDPNVIAKLSGLFNPEEIKELQKKGDDFKKRIANLSPTIIQKEYERITIELSWKSSKIEGNTYSLIDTEILIKDHKEAPGHKKEEAVMILNHKKALDYIFKNKEKFKRISLRDIEDVHRLLVQDLNVQFGLRSKAVGITGTNYRPLDNLYQIREAMEKMSEKINETSDPWTKALIALLSISHIQPFEDGNKRTSRLIANACLIAGDVCPLSFRSVNESDYKKAILLFYELGNASLMKKIFLEQFNFAVNNYFL
ncbi:MAG: Fic family protein [bacterium]|nr:Fic family protein [bacterium]